MNNQKVNKAKETTKVVSPEDARAQLGVAVAGDPALASALEVLVTQAENKKSTRKGSQFSQKIKDYLDHKLIISEERLAKAKSPKHPERMNFANGKTVREVLESSIYGCEADLSYDLVTMGYLKIVKGPVMSHHHEEG
jgi:hypothetical protein|tara:strand:- start:1764 stop:2177 length:414 start_codon:yes stop_codon:yes gene_type:complete